MRFGATFIALCTVVIAISLGVAAYLVLGFSIVEALATALTAASLLAAYSTFAGRAQERAEANRQITGLSRGTAELAHQVKELGQRIMAAEAEAARARTEARNATEPLIGEIEVLGQLVGQLAHSVAAHERALTFPPAHAPAAAPRPASPPFAAPVSFAAPAPFAAPEPPLPAARAPEPAAISVPMEMADDDGLLDADEAIDAIAVIRAAIEDNRIDIHLQPIVTLPQRKVRHYEALARLRTEDGTLLTPADYHDAAWRGGLTPMIDNLMVLRAAQVARRLAGKNREAMLCCSIAGGTLADTEFFPDLFDFLSRHRAIAASLVLALPQDAVRLMGPIEQENMGRLVGLGFRFAMDRVTSFELEPRVLAQQGFRFIKVPAALLLDRAAAEGATIAPSDFSNLFGRYGIDLIADGVEAEATVVDLLDYDLRFAQGTLFSAPRPVRPEVFQPGEQAEAVAQSAPAAPPVDAGMRAADAMRARRREADPNAAPRAPAERSPQGLVKLARTIMRRA
jgi:cyclic-di-GMP phosphodiesterase TipF (flagellum assembly factor)